MRWTKVAFLGVLIACTPRDDDGNGNKLPVAQVGGPASVNPGVEVTLDGSSSYDPDNYHPAPPHGIAAYSWTLTEIPSGSGGALSDSSLASVTLTPDVAGQYSASLVVQDEDGGTSDPASFSFSAIPTPKTLHLELTWDIDVSDVNIHLINVTEGGTWFNAPYDCYYANMTPDWGPAGPVGDPSLDLDDVNGYGPENIDVPEAEPDPVQYKVVVRYYSDDGLGGTNARLRVFDGSDWIYDQAQFLSQTGRTWVVGTVDMPGVVFNEIGSVYDCDFVASCPEP